jgi:hypothetical protein
MIPYNNADIEHLNEQTAQDYLFNNGIVKHHDAPNQGELDDDAFDRRYNCWGCTAYLLGWDDDLEWLDNVSIETYLDHNTVEIDEFNFEFDDPSEVTTLEQGRVLAFWDNTFVGYASIDHTALIVGIDSDGECWILHKPGACFLQYQTLNNAQIEHGYGSNITVHEVVKEG